MRRLVTLTTALVLAAGLAHAPGLLGAGSAAVRHAPPGAPAPGALSPSPPAPPLAAPLATATAAARQRLAQEIDAILASHPLEDARVGIEVLSVATGQVMYAHDADELLNPASNAKLFTTVAALARLGPEYRFATDFGCAGGLREGRCRTLYLRGDGDPALYTERVYGIAGELLHRGLGRVGSIVVDDSYFDRVRAGPGWNQDHGDKPYLAPVGAMSINHNAVAIYVTPADRRWGRARIGLEPASSFFKVENGVRMVPPRWRRHLFPRSIAAGEHQLIVVRGRVPVGGRTAVFYKKIDNPPLYAGDTFAAILRQRGVRVTGGVRLGTMPPGTPILFTSYSPDLAEIVRQMDKESNNFMAEQLFKTLGAEMEGTPGSWPKGAEAVADYLEQIGIPRGSYLMQNGSGLNDENRFSAAQIVRLLRHVATKTNFYPELASALGIAGRDGTVHSRMTGTPAEGRLRAKTGTLENVTALSGYVRVEGGALWAYSILVNDFSTGHGPVVAEVDRMGEAIATGGRGTPEAVSQEVTDPAELRAKVAAYLNLARLADKRNVPFLRSALAGERDPVLRAVAADAIFRSDPDDEATTLLDNVPTSPATFARLRAVAEALDQPTPLVSSLVDAAAGGNTEALDKLLLVAHEEQADESAAPLLSDGLQEIGRDAPDELIESLNRAPPAVGKDAVDLLARGIAGSDHRTAHPFLARLKALATSAAKNGPPTPALALYDRVREALAAIESPPPLPAKSASASAGQKAEPMAATAPAPSKRPGDLPAAHPERRLEAGGNR